MPRRRPAPRRGFAFLFTLLLAALLGVSLVVATELDSTLAKRERERQLLQIGHEFRQALARYTVPPGSAALPAAAASAAAGMPGAAQYPLQLDDLVLDRRLPRTVRHLRRIYVDPMTGKAEWGLVRQGGRIVGVYSLATGVPNQRDNFDPDDADFKGAQRYRDWVFMHPANRARLGSGPAAAASSPAGEAASAPQAGFGAVPPPLPGRR